MDDSSFTTRPEIVGTFGVVASSHWVASQVGMAVLEGGGNAFDAAISAAFVLHVVEPHMNGIGGDAVILIEPVADDAPTVVCGQGVAPAAATIEAVHGLGYAAVPGTGLAAAVVPGAFDAWMLILRDHGTIELADALAPAIGYAAGGAPVCATLSQAIGASRSRFVSEWPSSAETYLPQGRVPLPGELLRLSALAATLQRLIEEAGAAATREARIDRARAVFAEGFVADSIEAFSAGQGGLLRGQDLAGWRATYEPPLWVDHAGWQVYKAGPWTQGPVALQTLRLLAAGPTVDPVSVEGVHQLVEALKLAFADREAWYGDPLAVDVPLDDLLAASYAVERRTLIGHEASRDLRPGRPGGRHPKLPVIEAATGAGVAEPVALQVAASGPRHGDTCHIDVIDRWGNAVAATPSGGWLQGSPVIPALGFPLGTRGQMFWLQEGLASSLRPGSRPRTTLTPSMAHGPNGERLAFGSPGGDSQEQWSLQFFLRVVSGGFNLQSAIEVPMFQSDHPPNSFFPRHARPNHLLVESRFPAQTVAALSGRGHDVELAGPWSLGHNCAAMREPDGLRLRAAASPRGRQAYAVGR